MNRKATIKVLAMPKGIPDAEVAVSHAENAGMHKIILHICAVSAMDKTVVGRLALSMDEARALANRILERVEDAAEQYAG